MERDIDTLLDTYQKSGFSLHTISKEANFINYFENNITKAPIDKVGNSKSIDLTKVYGIGVDLGPENNIFALDIDGCIDINLIHKILKVLSLPEDYEWVIKSGSGAGYHIIYTCSNYQVIEEEDITFGYDSSQSIGPDFGAPKTNAYYPAPLYKTFYKMEFKWGGNLVLPPSNHLTGNNYRFINKVPLNPPNDVSIHDLYKAKEKFTSTYAEVSELSNFRVRKTDLSISDETLYEYEDCKLQESILICCNSKKVHHVDLKANVNPRLDPYYVFLLVHISWIVLNRNKNVVLRKNYNYLSLEYDGPPYLVRNNKIVFLEEEDNTRKYDSIQSVPLEKSKITLANSRNVFHELLFDINHAKRIVMGSNSQLSFIKSEIDANGLYLDPFKIPTAKAESLREDIFDEVDYIRSKDTITYENVDIKSDKNDDRNLENPCEYELLKLFELHLKSENDNIDEDLLL